MDLLDLAEADEPSRVKTPQNKLEIFPTKCFDPHKGRQVTRALEERDWRALRSLGVVWWDAYAERWFPVGPHFFDVQEFLEIEPLY